MGKEQFSMGLADFNQAQLDQIEALVQGLKDTDIANLATTVSELKTKMNDMGYANQPMNANYYNGSGAYNQFYTVVDVPSGKGKLFKLLLRTNATGSGEMRVTIDGTKVMSLWTRQGTTTTNGLGNWEGDIDFKTSLKVEVRSTYVNGSPAPAECGGTVDYGLAI